MNKLAMFATATLLAGVPAVATAADDAEGEAWLGVRMQRVDAGLAEALELKEDAGVLVSQVLADSPAQKAGLEKGDVVVEVDGKSVGVPADLRSVIRSKKPGDDVRIVVLRDGKRRTIEATLAEAADARMPMRDRLREHVREIRELRLGRERGWLGVQTQPLTGDLGSYFGAKEGGALVAEVIDDSPAAKVGLKAGDVITRVGDEAVSDPEDLRRIIGRYDEPAKVEITWLREGRKRSGQAELEIREAPAFPGHLGMGEGPGPNMMWFDHGDPAIRQRVQAFRLQADKDMDKAVEELRDQVKKLQEQVRRLERKVR